VGLHGTLLRGRYLEGIRLIVQNNMKQRRLAFAVLAVVGVIVAFGLVRHSSNGPAYEGKSAAQWFRTYRTASLAEQEDARDSFKMLGDRAVPYLLSVLSRSRRVSLV